ncbi:MAG: hypothetical protein J6A59_15340 [Lachnospiraceae bacterium]|nr:hypothetical protein [Lachnospiraceae bacterium]
MGLLDKFRAYLNEEEPEDSEEQLSDQLDYKESDDDFLDEDSVLDKEGEKPPKKFTWGARLKAIISSLSGKKDSIDMSDEDVVEEMRQTKTVNAEVKAVQDFCEQLVDVSYHMEDLKKEYQVVTSYLTDIQRIEELPIDIAHDLIENAKRIEMLDKNRQTYLQSENLLTMEQYKTMVRLEDEVVDTIKTLNEMEQRDALLKHDMGHLEGEKESLKYRRRDCSVGIDRLRAVLGTVLILFLLTTMVVIWYGLSTRANVTIPALTIGAIVMVVFAACYAKYMDYKQEIKEADAKVKRAVSLLNKVKAKYINNRSTLDYIYEKYGVNSSKELEYMWAQYDTMNKDAMRYTQANNDFRVYCDQLVKTLERIGLRDPLVWPKQTNALIDRREMVEIKHSLNMRRQSIREKLATCEKISDNAKVAIRASVELNPALESFVKELLTPFKVNV